MYSIATGNWTTLSTPYPADLGSDNACVTVGSKIYITSGYTDDYSSAFSTMYAFSNIAAGGVWERLAGAMRQPRGDFSMIAIGTAIYAYGGYAVVPGDWWCAPLNTIEKYDVAADQWADAGFTMKIASAEKDDGVTVGGRLYVIGGEVKGRTAGCIDTDIIPLNKVYSIDPLNAARETWMEEADLPEGRMRFSAEAFEGNIYVMGGQGALIDTDTLPVMYSTLLLSPGGGGGGGAAAAALGGGAIAGIVIACLAFAAGIAFARSRRAWPAPFLSTRSLEGKGGVAV